MPKLPAIEAMMSDQSDKQNRELEENQVDATVAGDLVHGDKVAGDKVLGNKITNILP